MAVKKQLGEWDMSASEQWRYRGMNVKRKATRRLKTSISMYMPNDIEVTYGAGYKDEELVI